MRFFSVVFTFLVVIFLVKNGTANNLGKSTFEKNCAICHGGNSSTMPAPNLFGQKAEYLERALSEFRNDLRHHDFDFMNRVTKSLDPRQIKDLVTYLENQDPCKMKIIIHKNPKFQEKFKQGQRVNHEKQCLSCHSSENTLTPLLAGQKEGYLKSSLLKLKVGLRHSHIFPEMNEIAESLSQEDIASVATYLGGLREWICRPEKF